MGQHTGVRTLWCGGKAVVCVVDHITHEGFLLVTSCE